MGRFSSKTVVTKL